MDIYSICRDLVFEDPYYGFFMMNMNKVEDDKISTAAVSFNNLALTLFYNKKFIDDMINKGMDWAECVIRHEVLHIINGHLSGIYNKGYNHKIMNYAMDLEINQLIPFPDKSMFLHIENFSKQLPEPYATQLNQPLKGCQYYYDVLINAFDSMGLIKWVKVEEYGDAHSFDEVDSSEVDGEGAEEVLNTMVKSACKDAYEECQKRNKYGTLSESLKETIKDLLREKEQVFNWKAYLRRRLGNAFDIRKKRTRKKESMRFEGAMGSKFIKKHKILVAVDTSGSVYEQELADFATQIMHIVKSGVDVDVIDADCEITDIRRISKMDDIISFQGRGGTSFKPAIDYYNEHCRDYTLCVYFTDGGAPLSNVKPIKEVIWIITPDGVKQNYPGKVVYVE